LSSEASSFLDRRCKYPGKPLTTFIPQITDSSLRLLEQLLQLNPKLRPTAEQALQFDYVNDAQLMCDYSDVASTPRRVDERFFDFEREDYKLDELQQMVREEVLKPCDDSIFFDSSPAKKVKLHNNKYASSATSTHATKSSPSKKKSSGVKTGAAAIHRRTESDANITEADEGNQYRTEIPTRQSQESDSSGGGGGGGQAVIARSKSAPPSPSPNKVDAISKGEKKQKRRFFLQGIQRIKQETEGGAGQDQDTRSDVSNSSRSTPSEQTTSRVHHTQQTGAVVQQQRGIQPVSARAKYLNNSLANSETAPVDLRAMEQHGGKKGVLSNFRDINFGSREGARQLQSAPPTDRNDRMTRLPSLKGSKKTDGGRR
jgi:serine/threonine protein kinase